MENLQPTQPAGDPSEPANPADVGTAVPVDADYFVPGYIMALVNVTVSCCKCGRVFEESGKFPDTPSVTHPVSDCQYSGQKFRQPMVALETL